MREPFLAIVISLTAASCGATAPKPVEPAEHLRGPTIHGYLEAVYDLEAAGTTFGKVKVWSSGAARVNSTATPRSILRVGFGLDCHSYEPMQLDLDKVRVESFQAKRPQRADIAAKLISGNLSVPAESSATILVQFELPKGIGAHDINAFRIKWSVKAAGRYFTEYTPFVQSPEQYAYVPVWGYYNPYHPWDYPYYSPFSRNSDYDPSTVIIVKPYPRRVVLHGHRRR